MILVVLNMLQGKALEAEGKDKEVIQECIALTEALNDQEEVTLDEFNDLTEKILKKLGEQLNV